MKIINYNYNFPAGCGAHVRVLAHLDDEEVGHLDAVDEGVLRHRLVDLGRLQRVENACMHAHGDQTFVPRGNLAKKCNEDLPHVCCKFSYGDCLLLLNCVIFSK